MKHKRLLCLMLLAAMTVACSREETGTKQDGIQVGKASSMRNLVPAQVLERQAAQQYNQLKQQMAAKKALAPETYPELVRLRAIAQRIIPQATRFNPRAKDWQW